MLERSTTVVDNLLKSVIIEICIEKNKNIIIGCMYRAGNFQGLEGGNVFKNKSEGTFSFVGISILIHINKKWLRNSSTQCTEESTNVLKHDLVARHRELFYEKKDNDILKNLQIIIWFTLSHKTTEQKTWIQGSSMDHQGITKRLQEGKYSIKIS